ncbi:hypothetical protein GMAR_ORF21 [Golden Marseillevirus]|uniref:hypothetical protein n=1 Tax=Golden Marseillevirus TaxID=1720526 RepID=UPI000877A9F9|nr:hypothetical protein GMAR_ORF21 [Golden Marseillevirus]ALX27396.1 hypothetical protein GMAR_ORF21 [Golden Marseillevirus]
MTSSYMLSQRKIDTRPVNFEARFVSSPGTCLDGEIAIPLLGKNGGCTGNRICVPAVSREAPRVPQNSGIVRHTSNLYAIREPSRLCSGMNSMPASSTDYASTYLWETDCRRSRAPPDATYASQNDYYSLPRRYDGTGFRDITSALSPRYYPSIDKKWNKLPYSPRRHSQSFIRNANNPCINSCLEKKRSLFFSLFQSSKIMRTKSTGRLLANTGKMHPRLSKGCCILEKSKRRKMIQYPGCFWINFSMKTFRFKFF